MRIRRYLGPASTNSRIRVRREEATVIKSAALSVAVGLLSVLLSVGSVATSALAWGYTGHVLINGVAAAALPDEIPDFMRTPSAIAFIGELGPELDRSKDAGKSHDADRDPGHYLDLGDDGTIGSGPPLSALPPTRESYDSALRAVGSDQYRMGFLPYAMVDGWQQVREDFAYWRYDDLGARSAISPDDRAWFLNDRNHREALTIRDVGVWGHYVGDGSQPLHVTVHYNGWGSYPNPHAYSLDKTLHARFEGAFVRAHVDAAGISKMLVPFRAMDGSIEREVARYLAMTNSEVTPLYEIEAHGGFAAASPLAVTFATACVANGASELRDLIVDAWRSSATATVGYPAVHMEDVLSGHVAPDRRAIGSD